jgi:sec-independent protein translocase protein TatA
MPFGIGIWELLVLGVALLVVFGPKRLPEFGRQLGGGMREFHQSITGGGREALPDDLPPPAEGGATAMTG